MKLKVPYFKLFKISPFKIFDISIVICFRTHATIEYLLESIKLLDVLAQFISSHSQSIAKK